MNWVLIMSSFQRKLLSTIVAEGRTQRVAGKMIEQKLSTAHKALPRANGEQGYCSRNCQETREEEDLRKRRECTWRQVVGALSAMAQGTSPPHLTDGYVGVKIASQKGIVNVEKFNTSSAQHSAI